MSSEPPTPDAALRHRFLNSLSLSLAATALGSVLWLASAIGSPHSTPREWGLLTIVPVTWYVGLALVMVGLLASSRTRRSEGVFAVASLLAAFKATPAIVYGLPSAPWGTKYLGVVQYVLVHGSVHWNVDIYQSWPAFFAAIAWLASALRIHDLLAVTTWWPLFIGALRLAVFYPLTARFIPDHRRRCMACAFVVLADTIGQDYFADQSVGVVLTLGAFLFAIPVEGESRRNQRLRISAALVCGIVVVPTHQLSPFFLVAGLAALVVFRIVRPWWLPIPIAVAAGGWALLHWVTLRVYLNLSQLGHLSNVEPAAVAHGFGVESLSLRLPIRALAVSFVLLGILAIATIIQQRSRVVFGLAACAVASCFVLIFTAYGNEVSYRALLFALPWIAILAASVDFKRISFDRLMFVVVPVLVVLHLFGQYPEDPIDVIEPASLAGVSHFDEVWTPRSTLIVGGGTPDTGAEKYLVTAQAMPVINTRRLSPEVASELLPLYARYQYPGRTVYILFSPQSALDQQLLGLESQRYYDQLEHYVVMSGHWKVVFSSGHTVLLRLVT
jgi:hypothetical protein